jgi:MoxR-like ATPase
VRPHSAEGQLKATDRKGTPYLVAEPENEGLVLLIDEIDKADANLPNGLLELLGNGDIGLPLGSVRPEPLRRPLTIITSNDERQLPPAFMRRCLILTMALPRPGESLINHLITFAAAHVEGKQDDVSKVPEAVIRKAAELVNELREKASEGERPPGPAEFLDLLRVVGGLGGTQKDMESQIDDLYRIVLIKEVAEAD